MRRCQPIYLWFEVVLVFSFALAARAELPSIRLDRLTPLGANAGSTVEVEIAGADIEEVQTLLFDHPGFAATPLAGQERKFQLQVAADTPPGTYDVRLVGRWGVSNPRLFEVTHGLRDVGEVEPNNEPQQSQPIEMDAAVNAMSDGDGQDVFRFAAKQGMRIVIECQAGKLDSLLDATLNLTGSDGRLLSSSSDYNGRDPLIDFVVSLDGDYLISVFDLSYRGGQPYRLLVTDNPQVETVWPRAVQAGLPTELTALGRNLPDGVPSTWKIDDLPLVESRFNVTAPADILDLGRFPFLEHPTDHSVLPTAATCTLNGFQVRLPRPDALHAQSVMVSATEVMSETEPNDKAEAAQGVTVPLVLSGRFDQPRDADWFEFTVPENGSYAIEVYCERIRGRGDPYLVVADEQGNRLTELDDFGHRINAFDGHLRDPSGMVNLNAERKYRVLVQDRYRRGGARFQYVLTLHKPQPDFDVAVIHQQNPGPGGTTIWKGGATYLDVVIHQRDGFNGAITLTAEDLPAGLHAVPTVINNNTRGTFVLWADANVPDFIGPIRLIATGCLEKGTGPICQNGPEGAAHQLDLSPLSLRREVRPYARVGTDPSFNSSRPTRELVVAIRDSAPYNLKFAQDRVEATAGQKLDVKLQLERRWPEFQGDVTILPLSLPGGFVIPNGKLSAGETETTVSIEVQNGRPPGEYTLTLLGQGQVPFHKDPKSSDRPNTLVSLPSRPLTVVVLPPTK